jgi:hypothetical protein
MCAHKTSPFTECHQPQNVTICYTSWCEDLAPSRSHAERCQPDHPCYLPPPPTWRVQDGQRVQHARPPLAPMPPPPPGVDGVNRQAGATPLRPLPHLPASPFTGVDGRSRRGGDTQQQYATLPAGSDPSLSSAAPSWPELFETGRAPPVSTRFRRERISFACMSCASPMVSPLVSQYAAQRELKKSRCPAGSEPQQQSSPHKLPHASGGGAAAVVTRPWAT